MTAVHQPARSGNLIGVAGLMLVAAWAVVLIGQPVLGMVVGSVAVLVAIAGAGWLTRRNDRPTGPGPTDAASEPPADGRLVPDLVFEFDRDGKILSIDVPPSAALESPTRLSTASVGARVLDLIPVDPAQQILQAIHTALDSPGRVTTVRVDLPPDTTVDVPSSSATTAKMPRTEALESARKRAAAAATETPVGREPATLELRVVANGPDTVRAICRDMSGWRRTETALFQARHAAEAANERTGQFVAQISHDLRTPLTGILGMTDLVLDTRLNEEQRDMLRGVRQSSEALLELVNNLLDLSRIGAGHVELDEIGFNLREGIYDFIEPVVLRAEEKGIELVVHVDADVPHTVVGDPGRLRQIFVNLVGNAIKFTDEGEVSIMVRPGKRIGDFLELKCRVRDTGIGIPVDRQAMIFDPFVQARAAHRFGGTGLGLAITKQLVELMGGTITVESEPDEGTTFVFTVNLKRGRGETSRLALVTRTDRLSPMRVLIVDPRDTSREALEELMVEWHLQPTSAGNGETAIDELRRANGNGQRRDRHDILLVDGQLPDMDLFPFIREAMKIDPRIRVVLLVSRGRRGDGEKCRELGVAAYLTKPVKPTLLRKALLSTMGLSGWQHTSQLITRHTLREHQAGPKLDVLLVEDHAVNRKTIVRLLEKRGHSVAEATTGTEALDQIEQRQFDVVLMDLQMPEMDGFEATAKIRERDTKHNIHTPIIAMTAHAMKSDRQRCLDAGMDDYLAKPVRAADLFEKLATIVVPEDLSDDSYSVSLLEPESADTNKLDTRRLGRDSVFDLRVALQSVEGDRELLKELIADLSDTMPDQMTQMQAALDAGNLDDVGKVAHSLKGAVAAFSPRVAELARRVETFAGADDREAVLQAVADLGDLARELGATIGWLLETGLDTNESADQQDEGAAEAHAADPHHD